jgi:acid phosphatase (class A)
MKKLRKKSLALLLGVVFLSSSALRAENAIIPPAASRAASSQPSYLNAGDEVWGDFPKAPALGSPVDESDLTITLTVQNTRNEEQKAEAFRDKNFSIKLLTDVIDPTFETKYPKTWLLLKQASQDGAEINSLIKKKNARLRPFVQHPTLVTPLFTVADFSYPSGHATGSQLQARLLGRLFPAQAEDLLHRARQVADGRVVAGAHYASDTEYGLALGDLVFQQLVANPKFVSDLTHAATEDNIPVLPNPQMLNRPADQSTSRFSPSSHSPG